MVTRLLLLMTLLSPFALEARLTSVAILPKKWTSYTPLQGDFTVKLPSTPKQINDNETQLFYSNDNEITFCISEQPLPADQFEVTLQKTLENGKPYELINKKRAQFQGRDALAFIYERDDKIIEGLYVASNERLYQVFAVYEKNGANQEKFRRFINSFHLLRAN